jgi:DNA topoisomerase-2
MDPSDQYRKHTHRGHILELPDTYVGSVENAKDLVYVVSEDGKKFVQQELMTNPGLYKLVDELLVNAHDQVVRLTQRKSKNPVKKIAVEVTSDTVSVQNDGEAIDVVMHTEYGVYIPQLVFGELLTSTNYNKDEKKLVGGKNGYGVKLVNIFAQRLDVTIVDSVRGLKYQQTFSENMTKISEPKITKTKEKSLVRVDWAPDLARFGLTQITPDIIAILKRRVYDLGMTVGKDVKVSWNDSAIKFRDLSSYASWYLPEDATIVTDTPQVGWNLAVSDSPTDKFFSVSFVNGIWTRSGKHVDDISSQVISHIVSFIETKKKIKVKPGLVRDLLAVFIECSVENPSFNSQTKEVLTTKTSCKLTPEFLKKITAKLKIVENILEQQGAKDSKEASKTDGKKTIKINVPKLNDATDAGGLRSQECTLILTEGDSAMSMAVSGLSQEQRRKYGIFPLKGKLLNVKDVAQKKVEQTEEIANLKKIIGLESGKKYKDLKSLRYGRIMIMTDQDYDGSHIRGLLINLFHELWHELLATPGFLTYMVTPIVKAIKGPNTKIFYTQYDYEEWSKTSEKGWKTKYYKGLGTSTRDEAKEYFKSPAMIPYKYSGKESDDAVELAFNKSMADNRKIWLRTHDRSDVLNCRPGEAVILEDFVNKDLIHFSNYNLERSIPNVMDGLKTSQRKIMFSAFKRNLKTEIRVAQFAGYVSEHSGYHHGEMSLNDAIVGMAQDFVGSNNIPWLVPQGQFGTRLQGGKDSASPRYIHTFIQPDVFKLVPEDDFPCLVYRDDDGTSVEPEWYAPIIPTLLVNGARGIGTGYSTFIPSYNPSDLKSMILEWLDKGTGLERELVPWTRGFNGKIVKSGKDFIVSGVWKVEKDTMSVTELPVGTWTQDFRESLDKLVESGAVRDYTDTSSDQDVNFKIKLATEGLPAVEKLLVDKIKLSNMHAFNSKCLIQKYDSPNEILSEFVGVRLEMYKQRIALQLKTLIEKLPYHENVVWFIEGQVKKDPTPELRMKTSEECNALLEKEGFVKIKESYDYLLNLPISSLTLAKAQKHRQDLVNLKTKITELENTNPRDLWKSELNI